MALPPQMAVPVAIKSVMFFSTLKSLPSRMPRIITDTTEMAVATKPVFEAVITSLRLIPKPISTMES